MLDGNAIAGMLEDTFGTEMTTAVSTCAGCGRRAPLAETAVSLRGPGVVVCCRHCGAVLAVVVERHGTRCVDLRGIASLKID